MFIEHPYSPFRTVILSPPGRLKLSKEVFYGVLNYQVVACTGGVCRYLLIFALLLFENQ